MNLEEAIGYAKNYLKEGYSIEVDINVGYVIVSLLNSDGRCIYMPDSDYTQCVADGVIKCVEVSRGLREPNMGDGNAKL